MFFLRQTQIESQLSISRARQANLLSEVIFQEALQLLEIFQSMWLYHSW